MAKGFFGAVAFMSAAVLAGAFAAQHSWNGLVYVSDAGFVGTSARNPAAIRPDLDFSGLVGAELLTATQKRLVSAAKIILQEQQVGVELGAFVTRGEDGKREHACQSYNRIALRFEAEGIAESGEKPSMEIEGFCSPSTDISRIEPIWIPFEKILAHDPANMDLSFDTDVRFKFDDMGTEWPSYWRLQSVRLFDESSPSREVKISGAEIREIQPSPLVVTWRAEDSRTPANRQ